MGYYIYILQSEKGGNLYVGSTENLEDRLKKHNGGKVRSTKSRRPFKLIYSEELSSRTEARKRENYLKSGAGREWVKKEIKEK